MSKLQKALGMLRGQSEAGSRPAVQDVAAEDQQNAAARKAQEVDPLGIRRRTDAPIQSNYLTGDGNVDEKLPDFNVKVSVEALHAKGLQPHDDDMDIIAQQFRQIKRPVLNTAFGVGMPETKNANVIMLASALPKTGKTFCAFNLAASIARERDLGAVLVDADVLKPNISRSLGLENRVGLIDYLLDPSVTIDDILVGSDLYGIVIVPAGRQHDETTELLASRRMKELVETLSQRFSARAIIVDTPPLLLTNEANVLAEHMGQIVLVVEAGVSSRETVSQAMGSLDKSKPINAILNKARGVTFGEYSISGYGYYSVPQQELNYARQED